MSKGSADTRTPNWKAREETWERVWGSGKQSKRDKTLKAWKDRVAKDGTERINQLVASEVQRRKEYDSTWKYEFDVLFDLIEELKDEGERTVKDYRESGLTVNTIEAEGFLRCASTLYNQAKHRRELMEESR